MVDGLTLRRIRQICQKTQEQVANAIGVSERYVKYIEHNEMRPSEELYNDYLDFCYHGTISRSKRKVNKEEKQESSEKPKRVRKK